MLKKQVEKRISLENSIKQQFYHQVCFSFSSKYVTNNEL